MRWPFVSRKRLERQRDKKKEAKAALVAMTKERDDLADRLRSVERELHKRPDPQAGQDAATTAAPQRFTTPMDRLENRFGEALSNKEAVGKYRARAN